MKLNKGDKVLIVRCMRHDGNEPLYPCDCRYKGAVVVVTHASYGDTTWLAGISLAGSEDRFGIRPEQLTVLQEEGK